MHDSTGSAPVLMATFSLRTGSHSWRPELKLHEVCVLQPGLLAVHMAEADAQFCDSSWPEACAAFEAEQLFRQSLKRRLRACCGLDMSACLARWAASMAADADAEVASWPEAGAAAPEEH